MTDQMSDVCLHIVGAGRAAIGLARAWQLHSTICIGAVLNRSLASAESATASIGAGHACANMAEFCARIAHGNSRHRHWVLIAVPDSAITESAEHLAAHWPAQSTQRPDLVWHLSGQLPVAVLDSLRSMHAGIMLASAHPVVSFANPQRVARQLRGRYCLLDGESAASSQLGEAFAQLGMHTIEAPAQLDRKAYHAALVMVSNFQCALHHMATQLLADAGLQQTEASQLLSSLAAGVLDNLSSSDSLAALTGPLERGDLEASARLLRAFTSLPQTQSEAASALATVVMDMAAAKGSISAVQLQSMRLLLKRDDIEPS